MYNGSVSVTDGSRLFGKFFTADEDYIHYDYENIGEIMEKIMNMNYYDEEKMVAGARKKVEQLSFKNIAANMLAAQEHWSFIEKRNRQRSEL